jgi:predicted aspartyl protease
MSYTFDSHQGLIFVQAELTGPKGNAVVKLALDTGATRTLVNVDILVIIGYEPALAKNPIDVTTGSGVESGVMKIIND